MAKVIREATPFRELLYSFCARLILPRNCPTLWIPNCSFLVSKASPSGKHTPHSTWIIFCQERIREHCWSPAEWPGSQCKLGFRGEAGPPLNGAARGATPCTAAQLCALPFLSEALAFHKSWCFWFGGFIFYFIRTFIVNKSSVRSTLLSPTSSSRKPSQVSAPLVCRTCFPPH